MSRNRRWQSWVLAMSVIAVVAGLADAGPRGARQSTPRRGVAPTAATAPNRILTIDQDRRIDINNLNMFVVNNGAFGYDLAGNYNGGLFFPNHTDKTAIYAAGLWIGARVGGEIRLAVAEYDQEYRPGRILSTTSADPPGDPRLIVYKVLPWKGVAEDTAHVDKLDADPDRGEDPLAHHSWSEYINGAKPFGAPTRIWNLPGGPVEGPDVLGDQMLWCVYNDLDPDAHTNEAGSTAPLGIQIEQTTFAFDRLGPIGNTIFVKYKIKNLGGNTLDSCYISQWADADLGGFTDDVVGSDTLPDLRGLPRSLGFIYNGTNRDDVYGDIVPALGVDFLQGPVSGGDTLGLSSFAKYINGTDPLSAEETYNYMQGLKGDGSPIVDPFGNVTHYMVAGDPFGPPDINWVDSSPADRRFFLTSGPFTMLPGDSQEVVVAIMVGQCGDRLQSLRALKFVDDKAQEAYSLGFSPDAIPPTPPAPVVTATELDGQLRLEWDTTAITADYPPGYTFEGYNIYQGETIAGPWKLVATWDSVNTVYQVFDTKFSETSCEPIPLGIAAYGANTGIRDFYTTFQDYVRGTTLKNGTVYYYAVTAYAVNPTAPANRVLESPIDAIILSPQRAASTATANMVRVVPNPYYAHSAYELSQFNRKIKFLNCPTQCTIRIFNLQGQLVRTIEKNDAGTSTVEWDTETKNGLPVGSGVYVYHVSSTSGGESVGRIVVLMEKERLNNF
ncbi:MAG: FlgD immunoglobulin-like domain containing protein [Candidatus Eisenbacteria bacterium]